MMELGAIVCTARSPRCDVCPIRDSCRWRAEGYPAYDGPVKTRQKRFEGSDRQVRGLVLAELRAAHRPVTAAEVRSLWPDAEQLDRALAGLLSDGLATGSPDEGYLLPHS